MRTRVHAVIAVKRLQLAKSRLGDTFTTPDRARLVLAMLSDTDTAVAATDPVVSVTVISPDPRVRAAAAEHGAWTVADPPFGATHGDTTQSDTTRSDGADTDSLNAALRYAAARTRARHGPGAVLAAQADLPALRPADLAAFLAAAPSAGRSFVPDRHGVGSTALLQADPGGALLPRFGSRSAQRHRESGAAEVFGDWPGLRHDVDTAADLDLAAQLGTGPATDRLLRDLARRERTVSVFPPRIGLMGVPGIGAVRDDRGCDSGRDDATARFGSPTT